MEGLEWHACEIQPVSLPRARSFLISGFTQGAIKGITCYLQRNYNVTFLVRIQLQHYIVVTMYLQCRYNVPTM